MGDCAEGIHEPAIGHFPAAFLEEIGALLIEKLQDNRGRTQQGG